MAVTAPQGSQENAQEKQSKMATAQANRKIRGLRFQRVPLPVLLLSSSSLNEASLRALYLIATTGSPAIPNAEQLSVVFHSFLGVALEVDTDKRPDAAQLLQHSFISKSQPLTTLTPLIQAARQAAKSKA